MLLLGGHAADLDQAEFLASFFLKLKGRPSHLNANLREDVTTVAARQNTCADSEGTCKRTLCPPDALLNVGSSAE